MPPRVNERRETKDGLEFEDWIYGKAPGRVANLMAEPNTNET